MHKWHLSESFCQSGADSCSTKTEETEQTNLSSMHRQLYHSSLSHLGNLADLQKVNPAVAQPLCLQAPLSITNRCCDNWTWCRQKVFPQACMQWNCTRMLHVAPSDLHWQGDPLLTRQTQSRYYHSSRTSGCVNNPSFKAPNSAFARATPSISHLCCILSRKCHIILHYLSTVLVFRNIYGC